MPGVTEALMEAAERALIADGFTELTVDRLVNEIGTTRPTFYRRYRNIHHLAFDIIVNRFGTGRSVDTGMLRTDLIALQQEKVLLLSSPLMRNSLPGMLESARSDPSLRQRYIEEFIEPRRDNVRRAIARAVSRGEIDGTGIDLDFVCDLLLGPLLTRAILPGSVPLDDRLAERSAEVVLEHLRRAESRNVPGGQT